VSDAAAVDIAMATAGAAVVGSAVLNCRGGPVVRSKETAPVVSPVPDPLPAVGRHN
jgi:hypothetical protein